MRLPWYAVLGWATAASCAGAAEHEGDGDDPRAQDVGIDAGVRVPCGADAPSAEGGVDAAAPDAQAPRCDVVLTTRTASDADRAEISATSGELTLTQWAENRSARPQTLRYRAACGGPLVTGLGSYDARRACLGGACMGPPPDTETLLAPGERVRLGTAYVAVSPGACNREGLAAGRYDVNFRLIDLTGAAVCGEPLDLIVR